MISPAPKPNASLPASRTEIKKVSDKQRAKREKNGERFISSTIAKTSLLDPHFRTRKSIKKKGRKPSEFARIYGSKSRVAWVKCQPCCVCAVRNKVAAIIGVKAKGGPSDNAHTETGGMGYKAGYRTIAPLCRSCHRDFDQRVWPLNQEKNREWIKAQAAQTQQRWLLHCGREGLDPETGKSL